MTKGKIRASGLNIIRKEAAAISAMEAYINEAFVSAVELIAACKGRLVISGVGKSAIIAQKIVATFNSTGTPAAFMHAADAIHGDLGMVGEDDILMIISKSGESPEIKALLPLARPAKKTNSSAWSGNEESMLAKKADIFLNTTVSEEACLHNLAPTSSTTAQLVMGDALAITLMEVKGFGTEDFARFHPGGTLGKKLYLRVNDIYIHNAKPQVVAGCFAQRSDHGNDIQETGCDGRCGRGAGIAGYHHRWRSEKNAGEKCRYFECACA